MLLILMSRALEICLAMLLATFPVQAGNRGRKGGVGIGQKQRVRDRDRHFRVADVVVICSESVLCPECQKTR